MILKFHLHEAETMIRSIMQKTQLSKHHPNGCFPLQQPKIKILCVHARSVVPRQAVVSPSFRSENSCCQFFLSNDSAVQSRNFRLFFAIFESNFPCIEGYLHTNSKLGLRYYRESSALPPRRQLKLIQLCRSVLRAVFDIFHFLSASSVKKRCMG